jgi:hypothetical protein
MKASFNWTLLRMDLLTKLLCVLSGTIDEWDTFISSHGDVGYFSDLDEFASNSPEFRRPDHAGQSLRSIKEAFERLKNHRRALVSLRESLSRDFSTVR